MKLIEAAFEEFNNQTILVIGDIMIDSYMWGNVDRISPEAPVPIISVSKREHRMGGAANVGLNIRALGAKAIMCAMLGNDLEGEIFKKLLKKRDMSDKGILFSDGRKTTVKTRIISSGQHLLRIDEEETDELTKEQEQQFIKHIDNLFKQFKFNAVIFEDYDKGNITTNIIDYVVKKANKLDIPTLVDPKKRHFLDYKNVTVFKPNFKEICEGVKIDIPKNDYKALHESVNILNNKLNAKHIMVTLSELGIFVTDKSKYHKIPAQIRDIADVSGAGDTVISVATCCLAAKLDIDIVAAISNIAGGLVCEKIGVVPIEKELLLQESVSFFEK